MNHPNEQLEAPSEPEFAALIAIDWADRKHYWTMRTGGIITRGELENTPEAVEQWAAELYGKFGGRPVALAVEQRRGALITMLRQYAQLCLYPVHPSSLAKYRETWYPSRSKNDIKDADLLCEILAIHRNRLRRLDPDTEDMRLLQMQVENRRKLVDERTALGNKLKDALKIYYPQIPHWQEDVTTELVCDLLKKWPTLQALKKARPDTLGKFFREHRVKGEETIQRRIDEIRGAIPATTDRAVIDASVPMVEVWIGQIELLREAIREIEKSIRDLAAAQEDWMIFESLPGAGPALAPRLMAAMGTQRGRFGSAGELQSFAGIAPVREASGKSAVVHFRLACPKFMRQTFHEWAACSIPQCAWAKEVYDALKARGKSHHMAVRALAFKWMRILYRCWENRVPYQEEIYLASLAKRRSPSGSLALSVQIP
jgi:transposase